MHGRRRSFLLALSLVLSSMSAAPLFAQFDKLLGRIPTTTNTIILLNAEKVMNSEVALRDGWRDNFDKAIEAGLTQLPADSMQYVLASQMDFEFMQPV